LNPQVLFVHLLKQIQHLPVRTSTAAVLILAGQIPIEAELHKRMLSLFRNIAENKGSMEYNIKPAPISAYTVLRAVCILSGTTSCTPNFEEVSLLIPK
jgi:enamine deaminase RidA (YjgF/YER057c/UK114 family)